MLIVKAPDRLDRKIITGSRDRFANPHRIPVSVLGHVELNEAIGRRLPANYNFEIHKTLWRIQTLRATRVALQLPEGLALFACAISDILTTYAYHVGDDVAADGPTHLDDVIIMGDVTYGACCVDDFAARALGVDLLVHYGHSCLVPSGITAPSDRGDGNRACTILYVFVGVVFDAHHLARTIRSNFSSHDHLILAGTVQFVGALPAVISELSNDLKGENRHVTLAPRDSPLSRGEVLGCTAPTLPTADVNQNGDGHSSLVFVADGRFHLEALMLANPRWPAFYLYDPYAKTLTRESYDHAGATSLRHDAVDHVTQILVAGVRHPNSPLGSSFSPSTLDHCDSFNKALSPQCNGDALHQCPDPCCSKLPLGASFSLRDFSLSNKAPLPLPIPSRPVVRCGLILSTLGRQGSPRVLHSLVERLESSVTTDACLVRVKFFTVLLSEILPDRLSLFSGCGIDFWVQVGCPRLSVDWGHHYPRPVLTPYELVVALGQTEWRTDCYPMDYYSYDSAGPWTPNHITIRNAAAPKLT